MVKLNLPAAMLSDGLTALAMNNNRNLRVSWSNQPHGRAKIVGQTESKGLDPFYYRANTPDEGTLVVFTANSPDASPRSYQPPMVTMPALLEEIYQHLGMASVQGWYPKTRSGEREAFTLQVEFSSKANPGNVPDYYAEHEAEISRILGDSFRVWIYENPDGPDRFDETARYLLCTVNANYRVEGQLDGVLHYGLKDAMWEVK
ncbi:MAG: hypothetical protein WAP23_03805 [Candidatus Spechtbacterales bacterium]